MSQRQQRLRRLPDDHNYRVDGLPRQVRAKITELVHASQEMAFIGSYPPEDHDEIRENFLTRKYNLERTIKTHLERKS